MKKHLCIVAAAALAVGGMGLSVSAQDTTTNNDSKLERAAEKTGDALKNAADKTGDALHNAKDKTKDALGLDKNPSASKHSEEINDLLAQVAEAALTKSGLDDMAERFVDADRNRLGQNQDALKNNDALDGRVAQLQKDWKEKYGHEFDIKDEDAVYSGFAMIHEGEIGGARTAADRSGADRVDVKTDVNTDRGTAKVDVDNKTGVDAPKANTDGQTAADRNLNDPGRNVATVMIPESHGKPALQIPLIHEAGGWKIDIPDTVDSNKLRDNVQAALTHCDQMKDKWPADEKEAYRGITHSVLSAIFDKQAEAQPAADRQPAQ